MGLTNLGISLVLCRMESVHHNGEGVVNLLLLFVITQYNSDTHNTRTRIIHMQTLVYELASSTNPRY